MISCSRRLDSRLAERGVVGGGSGNGGVLRYIPRRGWGRGMRGVWLVVWVVGSGRGLGAGWICDGFLRSGGWILGRGCLGKLLKGSGGIF